MKHMKAFLKDPLHRAMTAVFLLILILNILTFPFSDDLIYSLGHGFLDKLHLEVVQYMNWTGRSVAHLIDRAFLSMPRIIFAVCNSFCFVTLIWLMNVLALDGSRKVSWKAYSCTAVLLFLCVPVFGQTVLWETGSCNYLWTTTIILAFLLQYRQERRHGNLYPIGMFFFGLAAGWTNENTGGACILMVLLYLLLDHKEKKTSSVSAWTGLAGAVLGFAMMVIAPGNRIRALDFVSTNGKAYDLIHDWINAIKVLGGSDGMLVMWLIYAILLGLLITLGQRKSVVRSACYALSSAACVFAIILSPVPVLYDRSMFGSCVLLITAIMVLISKVQEEPVIREILASTLGAGILLCSFHYCVAAADLAYLRYQWKSREGWVRTQRNTGNLNPVLPILNTEFVTEYDQAYGLVDLVENPMFVNNVSYAELHELESVTVTSIDRWNRIYRNGDPELMNITDPVQYIKTLADRSVVLLLTSSDLKQEDVSLLSPLNVQLNGRYVCMIYHNGVVEETQGEDPVDLSGSVNGQYVYLSAQTDPTLCDILIENREYTNDREGLSLVVLDEGTGRVLDSVTIHDGKISRCFVEK